MFLSSQRRIVSPRRDVSIIFGRLAGGNAGLTAVPPRSHDALPCGILADGRSLRDLVGDSLGLPYTVTDLLAANPPAGIGSIADRSLKEKETPSSNFEVTP
jgi:hypothetical protein